MDAYQVWHRDGKQFRKAADILADDLLEAVIFSQNDERDDDPHEGQRWIDQAGVITVGIDSPRSTSYGDIIIASDGREYEVTLIFEDDAATFGFHATTAIAEQGYVEWLAEQPEQIEPESSPAERERLFQSWRDDASQRPLAEKGVDYSDAPYGESNGESYAAKRAAAIASAKFHQPPEPDAPSL